ncbi:MAG: hypothetical protein AAF192_01310 [Pseudomonadota bacterium]
MLWKLATFFLIGMVVLAMVSARPRKGDRAFDAERHTLRARMARLFRRAPPR